MLKHFCLFFSSTLVFLYSCNSPSDKPDQNYLYQVIKQDSGIFRGVELGITPEALKKAEHINFVQESSDLLQYELKTDSLNIEIEYGFGDQELVEMSCNVFPVSENTGNILYDSMVTYYRTKYGEPTSEKGYLSWKVKEKTSGFIARILITTDVSEKNLPIINLSIYRDVE